MSTDFDFQRGVFHTFRATTKIHLGKFERDIFQDDVVEYDGQTLKYGGEEFAISSLKAAVKLGWFVVESDNVSNYIPQSADIKIRPAQSANQQRGEAMKVESVADEERVVGTVGKMEVISDSATNEDAKPIGKISTPAKQSITLTDSSQASRMISQLDNTPPKKVTLTEKTASGDVTETMVGDELSEILPNASTSGKPTATKTATTTETATTDNSKIVMVETPIGNIKWDMSVHWTKRASTIVEDYSSNEQVLNAILAVESKGVQKRVKANMADS